MEDQTAKVGKTEIKLLWNLCADRNKMKKIRQLLSEENLYSESGTEAINGLLKSGIITFADEQPEFEERSVRVTEIGYEIFRQSKTTAGKKSTADFEIQEIFQAIYPGGRGMNPGRHHNEATIRRNKRRILMIVITILLILILPIIFHLIKS